MRFIRSLTKSSRLSPWSLFVIILSTLHAVAQAQAPPPALTPIPGANLTTNTPTPTTPPLPISLVTSVFLTAVGPGITSGLNTSAPRPTTPAAHSGGRSLVLTTQVFTSTLQSANPTPTSTSVPSSGSDNDRSTPDSLPLKTKLTGAWGTLGVLLILSGAYHAFVGQRIRWTMYGLTGFYSFALLTLCLILLLGVKRQVDDPSEATQGLFLFGCICGGALGSLLFIIFNDLGDELTGALGGLLLGLFIQAFKQDGLIRLPGFRWILYSSLGLLFTGLARWDRTRNLVTITSTSIVGASALVLGVDCFSRAGLKEYYARNLGFDSIFADRHVPVFANHHWPLVVPLQIELGVLGGIALMAMASQRTTWMEIRDNLRALRTGDEDRRIKAQAARAAKSVAASVKKDLKKFEKRRSQALKQGTIFEEHDVEKHAGTGASQQNLSTAGAPTLPALQRRHTRDTSQAGGTSGAIDIPTMPTLSSSMSRAFSDKSSAPTSVGTPRDEDRRELTDGLDLAGKFSVLDEIETIRRSIRDLKASNESKPTVGTLTSDARARRISTIDFRSPLTSSSALDLDARPAASMTGTQRSAPWTTSDRRRDTYFGGVPSASASGSGEGSDAGVRRARSRSHGPTSLSLSWAPPAEHSKASSGSGQDQWEGPTVAPSASARPVSMYLESTSPQLPPLELDGASSQGAGAMPRTGTLRTPPSAVLPLPSPTRSSFARPPKPEQQQQQATPRPDLGSYRHSYAAGQSLSMAQAQPPTTPQRTIIDSADALAVRFKAALPDGGSRRQSSAGLSGLVEPSDVHKSQRRHSQLPASPGRSQLASQSQPQQQRQQPAGSSAMTLHELQSRHRARLSALQAPVTQKMTEQVALETAKEQWKKKAAHDKRAWDEKLKQREAELKAMEEEKQRVARAAAAARSSKSPGETQKRGREGGRRTEEWRRSILTDLDPVTRDRASKAAQRAAQRQSFAAP